MGKIFTEENGVYTIDFSSADWATDKLFETFHQSGVELSDVDFVAESDNELLMVEYKNACIAGASRPDAFCPSNDKSISKIANKFYDSYFYLTHIGKRLPAVYAYILEYPLGDATTRRMIRNKIQRKLPFLLQEHFQEKVIKKLMVCSIDEWNEEYGQYPVRQVMGQQDS